MPSYSAPVDDTLFILNDLLELDRYNNLPGFADITADMLEVILRECAKLCEEELHPLNQIGDNKGCVRDSESNVTTPPGFKEAYRTYANAGWISLAADSEYGGQGLPYTLSTIVSEFISGANIAFSMYPGLTSGAIAAVQAHGTDQQKSAYLPNMNAGIWSGTMNLTESHCGTDLGLIRTKAEPQQDDSYTISGTKVFISAGEHDLTENIIHLVLARITGAPEGTKGISLFLVPKFLIGEDGNANKRNGVSCGSLEEKMGIHGNATCVMNYDQATGWLVGEANKGLRAMFTMMNEARLHVGVQGLGQSEIAYQNAASYARERIQGRAMTGVKAPQQAADPIIVHPDVRRILMTIKAFNEGARALVLWTALKGDISHRAADEADRQMGDDYMGLMTPVIKGFLTDKGFDNTVMAQQVYGGHGYIAEWGMEQFVRDARIAMIYEGANGIQALDLVGRKLPKDGGRAITMFLNEMNMFIDENASDETLKPYIDPLKAGIDDLKASTLWFMNNALTKPDNAGAGSTDYMHLMGLVALGFMWIQMVKVSQVLLEKGDPRDDYLKNKFITGRFFMERLLPETATLRIRIENGAETTMALVPEAF